MKKITTLALVSACGIAVSAVMLSTSSDVIGHPAIEKQIMVCKIISMAMIFVLMIIVEIDLIKNAHSAATYFYKQEMIRIAVGKMFKMGMGLHTAGLIIVFAWLINQVFNIQVMPLKCSIAIMAVGISLYAVSIVALSFGPKLFEKQES